MNAGGQPLESMDVGDNDRFSTPVKNQSNQQPNQQPTAPNKPSTYEDLTRAGFGGARVTFDFEKKNSLVETTTSTPVKNQSNQQPTQQPTAPNKPSTYEDLH